MAIQMFMIMSTSRDRAALKPEASFESHDSVPRYVTKSFFKVVNTYSWRNELHITFIYSNTYNSQTWSNAYFARQFSDGNSIYISSVLLEILHRKTWVKSITTRYVDGTPTFEDTPVTSRYIHPPHQVTQRSISWSWRDDLHPFGSISTCPTVSDIRPNFDLANSRSRTRVWSKSKVM